MPGKLGTQSYLNGDSLGLGAKLNFAFITVILVVVLGHVGYALFIDWKHGQDDAKGRLQAVLSRLDSKEINQLWQNDVNYAVSLSSDPAVDDAFSKQDHEALGKAVKAFTDKTGLDAIVTVLDNRGKVLYSSDAPAKFGYSIIDKCPGIDEAVRNTKWTGFGAFSPTGQITATSMVSFKIGPAMTGVVAVSNPINNQFLTGIVNKFKFLEDPSLKGVDLAVVSFKGGKVVAFTSGLVGTDRGFLNKVNETGIKAIPEKEFEYGGRLWLPRSLTTGGPPPALILASTQLPDVLPKALFYAGEMGAVCAVAIIMSLIFSTAISGSVRQSLAFLTGRARDLAANKLSMAPLEGLQGEWLELAELMDTAVASLRSTIHSMKGQLSARSLETEEKSKQEDSEKIVHLNRQISDKTRQITELSKQVNVADKQSVLMKQKLDAVLQISTDGFLMLDQFGSVLSANHVFLNWMGVTEGEIAGRFCLDLVKKPGEPRNNSSSQPLARTTGNPADLINQFYPEAVVYHNVQERSVDVLAHLQPVVVDNNNINGWIMVLHDRSLRSEVAQLRTEIVAILSDSIRAQLISAESIWKSILAKAAQTMHPSVGQALAQLHVHYEQLIGLVDSLLMMYGGIVPPPVIPREAVVVTRLVAECLEEVATAARERQLSLDYKTGTGLPNLNTDREALKRVISQLLEKMIADTTPGGKVRVESQVKGPELRIGVTCSGPALPQEELDEMFVGFIEGKHAQSTYGSRLSMYLAKNNIDRLGGKIWAEADRTRGTTSIFFILPI